MRLTPRPDKTTREGRAPTWDRKIEASRWLAEGVPPDARKKREPEVSVGELAIRNPNWDETERIAESLDLVKTVEQLPATVASAIVWDSW
tara:strand:+ start:15169 stop:15438 length:270 start_codon:yes stop_codon:yes gene_type:complete